jgi:hypothetical protein
MRGLGMDVWDEFTKTQRSKRLILSSIRMDHSESFARILRIEQREFRQLRVTLPWNSMEIWRWELVWT